MTGLSLMKRREILERHTRLLFLAALRPVRPFKTVIDVIHAADGTFKMRDIDGDGTTGK